MSDDEVNDKDISRRGLLTAGAAAAVATSATSSSEAQFFDGAVNLNVLNSVTIDQVVQLRYLNEAIIANLVTNEEFREGFIVNPKGYLGEYGLDLPDEAFPDSDSLRALLEEHSLVGFTPVNPEFDSAIGVTRPSLGEYAIAVCAVVV